MALTQIDAGAIQNNAITTAQLATNTEFVFTNVAVDVITSKTLDANLTISANGTGIVTIDDDLVVTGNVTFSGSATRVDTEVIALADNIIELNSNYTSGVPTENAGVSVIRGSAANVSIRWNETDDQWEYTNDGTTFSAIGSGGGGGVLSSTIYTPGALVVGNTNVVKWYPNVPININKIVGRVVTAGSENVIANIKKSGNTELQLSVVGNGPSNTSANIALLDSDYMTVEIANNGIFASDLYVSFIYTVITE